METRLKSICVFSVNVATRKYLHYPNDIRRLSGGTRIAIHPANTDTSEGAGAKTRQPSDATELLRFSGFRIWRVCCLFGGVYVSSRN